MISLNMDFVEIKVALFNVGIKLLKNSDFDLKKSKFGSAFGPICGKNRA